jgi:hypothetical protein
MEYEGELRREFLIWPDGPGGVGWRLAAGGRGRGFIQAAYEQAITVAWYDEADWNR